MNHMTDTNTQPAPHVQHPRFARYYERMSRGRGERRFLDPLRKELIEQAYGRVLEIGAGNGLNFSFYLPEKVNQVEALEPDTTMLSYAHSRLSEAKVSLNLTQATAEALPFEDGCFDCVVATLVFCSVTDPARSFKEIRRVLKPDGRLLLLEHVRSNGSIVARLQDLLTPLTRRVSGNCHWNRNTRQAVIQSGFQLHQTRLVSGGLLPIMLLQATP